MRKKLALQITFGDKQTIVESPAFTNRLLIQQSTDMPEGTVTIFEPAIGPIPYGNSFASIGEAVKAIIDNPDFGIATR